MYIYRERKSNVYIYIYMYVYVYMCAFTPRVAFGLASRGPIAHVRNR